MAAYGLLGGIAGWLLRSAPPPAKVFAGVLAAGAVYDSVIHDIHGLPFLAGLLVGVVVTKSVPGLTVDQRPRNG